MTRSNGKHILTREQFSVTSHIYRKVSILRNRSTLLEGDQSATPNNDLTTAYITLTVMSSQKITTIIGGQTTA